MDAVRLARAGTRRRAVGVRGPADATGGAVRIPELGTPGAPGATRLHTSAPARTFSRNRYEAAHIGASYRCPDRD